MAVSLKVNISIFVPPKDEAALTARTAYKASVTKGSYAARSPPTVYLVIRNGHFKALSKPDSSQSKNFGTYNVLDLMRDDICMATNKYVLI